MSKLNENVYETGDVSVREDFFTTRFFFPYKINTGLTPQTRHPCGQTGAGPENFTLRYQNTQISHRNMIC